VQTSTAGSLNSFSSLYGSSLLNSQVLVSPRRFDKWSQRGITHREPAPDLGARRAPFTLVVSPDGRHGVLVSQLQGDVFDQLGMGWLTEPEDMTTFDDRLFIAGSTMSWAGESLPKENFARQSALVRRIGDVRFCSVWNQSRFLGSQPQPPALGLMGGLRAKQPFENWHAHIPGNGVAAIAEDFTAFVAMDSRKLKVFAPRADDQGEAILEGEHDVGMVAERISLIGAHVLLLAAEGSGTRLSVLTKNGTPIHSLTVPFEVLQPAVAGAGKRVYLAGKGLAALDDGKVTWRHESSEPLYVSSFEDGSLAVANGKRLDFLKPDGTIEQSFEAQDPLVAPPAIAGDGSVWAASATTLYIAR